MGTVAAEVVLVLPTECVISAVLAMPVTDKPCQAHMLHPLMG